MWRLTVMAQLFPLSQPGYPVQKTLCSLVYNDHKLVTAVRMKTQSFECFVWLRILRKRYSRRKNTSTVFEYKLLIFTKKKQYNEWISNIEKIIVLPWPVLTSIWTWSLTGFPPMNQTTSYVTWGQTTHTAAWYPYLITNLTGLRNCPFISGRAALTLLIYPPLFFSLVITLYPPTYKGVETPDHLYLSWCWNTINKVCEQAKRCGFWLARGVSVVKSLHQSIYREQ